MAENELNQTGTQAPVASGVVQASGEVPAGQVDVPPDPAVLKADIDRLLGIRDRAKEDAEYWRRQKVETRKDYFTDRGRPADGSDGPAASAPPADVGVGPAPKQADFDNYDQYLDAKLVHERKILMAQWRQEQQTQEAIHGRRAKMNAAREKIITEGMSQYADFEGVVLDNAVPITPVVMEILAECEKPTDVAYYLGKNRSVAIQVARSTPIQAARMIARIEAEIKTSGGVAPPSPKIPGAPPPITPVGPSSVVEKDPAKMSQKEFEAWYEKVHGHS